MKKKNNISIILKIIINVTQKKDKFIIIHIMINKEIKVLIIFQLLAPKYAFEFNFDKKLYTVL